MKAGVGDPGDEREYRDSDGSFLITVTVHPEKLDSAIPQYTMNSFITMTNEKKGCNVMTAI